MKEEEISPPRSSPTMVGSRGDPIPELSNMMVLHSKASEKAWVCPASAKSLRTTNPIRKIVDPIVANWSKQKNHEKEPISLALGDPTVGSSFTPCPVAIDAVIKTLQQHPHAAGYVSALGVPAARSAIAQHHSLESGQAVSPDQVIVANGCSGALELALTALLDPDTVLLVPQPGFPLYQVIAKSHGATVVHYRLMSDRNWQIDFEHLQTLLTKHSGKVRGIVVNNPSNPTGAVYSQEHLEEIVCFCEENRLPIVADEIYGNLVFGENAVFDSIARVSSGRVPVIVASGLGKQYLLPGWRVGWIVFFDSHEKALREVEAGAKRLAQVVLGASHLAQSAVAPILVPQGRDRQVLAEWKTDLQTKLSRQSHVLCDALSQCDGLTVISPQGAMYAMVKVNLNKMDGLIKDDLSFTQSLLKEENVFVLPGGAFGANSDCFVRVVYCATEETLLEAANRISSFVSRHQIR